MIPENSPTEPQLTKVPEVLEAPLDSQPKAEEPMLTSSRKKKKTGNAAPAGKIWVRGRLRDDPNYKPEMKEAQKALGRERLARGRAVVAARRAEQKVIREKISQGIPVSPKEAALAVTQIGGVPATTNHRRSHYEQQLELLNKTANLIIKPANVHELRLRVEKAATDLKYDPFTELIKLVQEGDMKVEDKIAIHKTLLPFLVPTLPPIPKDAMEVDEKKVKVVVQQLHFAPEIKAGDDLFKDRPKGVDVEILPPEGT